MIVLHGILPTTGHGRLMFGTRILSAPSLHPVRDDIHIVMGNGDHISAGHHRANARMYCRTFCLSLSDKAHFQAPITVSCSPP